MTLQGPSMTDRLLLVTVMEASPSIWKGVHFIGTDSPGFFLLLSFLLLIKHNLRSFLLRAKGTNSIWDHRKGRGRERCTLIPRSARSGRKGWCSFRQLPQQSGSFHFCSLSLLFVSCRPRKTCIQVRVAH